MVENHLGEPVNSDLLELSTHSHDIRNRLGTIKNSAELLLQENLPMGDRELLLVIKERVWSAIDLADTFTLRRALNAGCYRPFRKDHRVSDLIDALWASLGDATGVEIGLTEPGGTNGAENAAWYGDEHLLLLTARNIARMLVASAGPSSLRMRVRTHEGALCLELEAARAPPGPQQLLGEDFAQARAFANALGGRLTRSSLRPCFVLTLGPGKEAS